MSDSALLQITLFDPDNTLVSLLRSHKVRYRKRLETRKFVVATDETIEVVDEEDNEHVIENLVAVFVTWLKDKQQRKIQVQLNDGSIVYMDANRVDEIRSMLLGALKITIFDPEYNNAIINKR